MESSPLTSPEPSQSSSIRKATSRLKRQRIDSEDEGAGVGGYDSQEEAFQDAAGPSVRTRKVIEYSEDEEDESGALPTTDDYPPPTGRLRGRRASTTSSTHEPTDAKSKGKASKAKAKSKSSSGQPKKKKLKKGKDPADPSDDDLHLSDAVDEESDLDMEPESEELSELSEEDYEQPKGKGKGKAGGRGGKAAAASSTKKATKDIIIKAKDEGARARSESAPLTQGPAKTKPSRSMAKGNAETDDMDVDVVGASSPSHGAEGNLPKEEEPPAPPKKRKLPTIKKNKSLQPSAASTPGTSGAAKSTPGPSTSGAKGILPDIKPVVGAGPRKPAAMMGIADVDLSNKSLYNELFNKSGSSSSATRRAKDERQKEIENMKKEWKAKREAEQMQNPPFDLQAQTEKLLRFEDKLRAARSGALYPNALAGKWRELYERERNRAREQAEQEGRPHINGQPMVNGRGHGPT